MTKAIQPVDGTFCGRIVVVCELTQRDLLHFKCDLKAVQINVLCSLGHNSMEATKNRIWLPYNFQA